MGNYDLPHVSDNRRWYLKRHSNRYACLLLQEKKYGRWVTIADDVVAISGYPISVEVAIKEASSEIIRIINAPEVEYGVIS